MMTNKISRLYKGGSYNEEFLNAINKADGDGKPGFFSDDIEKTLFATVYYGWLVGKYGSNWDLHI